MSSLKSLKLSVSKRTLFMFAALIWGIAGTRVMGIGYEDIQGGADHLILNILFAGIVFWLFFQFIFLKIYRKHAARIINKPIDKHCVFSFFDVKGYIMMFFMIFFGISIRAAHIVNPEYLGTFYLGLGGALLSAGILFGIGFLNFNQVKVRYKNQSLAQ